MAGNEALPKPEQAETKPATRPETKAETKPAPKESNLGLKADPTTVMVDKEKSTKTKISVTRDGYEGDITLKFTPEAGSGLTVGDGKDVTIPKGKDDVEVEVKAAKDAKDGKIAVTASGE